MKKTILTIAALFTLYSIGFCQSLKPAFSSNPALSFEKFISGVKYAEIGLNTFDQEQVDNQTGIAGFYYLAQRYLFEMGFEYVALTSAEKTKLDIEVKSYCEYTMVMFGGNVNKNSISNPTISFISCNGDIFSFTSDKKFNYGKFSDVEKKMLEDWQRLVKTKGVYKPANQLQLPVNLTDWTKSKTKQYLTKNSNKLDSIEGIYERVRLSFEDLSGGKYTVGVIKNPDEEGYLMVYFSGAKNAADWKSGEIKAILNKTATKGFYSVHWISRDKSLYEDVYCTIDQLGFIVYSSGFNNIAHKFVKIFPYSEK